MEFWLSLDKLFKKKKNRPKESAYNYETYITTQHFAKVSLSILFCRYNQTLPPIVPTINFDRWGRGHIVINFDITSASGALGFHSGALGMHMRD